MKFTEPCEQALQLTGIDDGLNPILSVVAKRTYTIEGDRCVLALEQLPLLSLTIDPDEPEVVIEEADIWPFKRLTDVVVRGHVYPQGPRAELIAAVTFGQTMKALHVSGDREVGLNASGRIQFSEPKLFDKIPLSYKYAYGGIDRVAESKYGNPYEELKAYGSPLLQNSRHSPFRYPRNGVGKGFVVEATTEALENARLPNLEDPDDRLAPERFVVGSPFRWPLMPLPWCTDWASLGTFPRYSYFGSCPLNDVPVEDFPEVKRALLATGHLCTEAKQEEAVNISNAGSFGLQLRPIAADGVNSLWVELVHLHPDHSKVAFRLPSEAPRISVGSREGKLTSTVPVLHHIVIEPDFNRVSVVWRGSCRTLRPYLLEEIVQMPFEVVW